MLPEILELFAYNRWANARTLRASAPLSPADFTRDLRSSFPSVRDTLVHVMGAEWIWLMRWQGTSPPALLSADGFPDQAAIAQRWQQIEHDQQQYLRSLTEADLQRVIGYRNTKGQPYAYPLWRMMRHVVNHSSYHRGQIAGMLRQLGRKADATDFLVFHDELGVELPPVTVS